MALVEDLLEAIAPLVGQGDPAADDLHRVLTNAKLNAEGTPSGVTVPAGEETPPPQP